MTVLAVSVAAVLAGARSYVAIAEWSHDLPVSARVRLGVGRCAPSESTIRRVLQRVDSDALDVVLSDWPAARVPAQAPDPAVSRPGVIARAVAVDGKTARGARRDTGGQEIDGRIGGGQPRGATEVVIDTDHPAVGYAKTAVGTTDQVRAASARFDLPGRGSTGDAVSVA